MIDCQRYRQIADSPPPFLLSILFKLFSESKIANETEIGSLQTRRDSLQHQPRSATSAATCSRQQARGNWFLGLGIVRVTLLTHWTSLSLCSGWLCASVDQCGSVRFTDFVRCLSLRVQIVRENIEIRLMQAALNFIDFSCIIILIRNISLN